MDLNALYTNNVILGMLKSEHFESLNMVFSFVEAFVDRDTGEECDYPMMRVRTMFFELERRLRQKDSKNLVNDELLGRVRVEVQKCKTLVRKRSVHTDRRGCIP